MFSGIERKHVLNKDCEYDFFKDLPQDVINILNALKESNKSLVTGIILSYATTHFYISSCIEAIQCVKGYLGHHIPEIRNIAARTVASLVSEAVVLILRENDPYLKQKYAKFLLETIAHLQLLHDQGTITLPPDIQADLSGAKLILDELLKNKIPSFINCELFSRHQNIISKNTPDCYNEGISSNECISVENSLIRIFEKANYLKGKFPNAQNVLSKLELGKEIASVLSKPLARSLIECLVAISGFKGLLSHASKEVRSKAAEIIIELIKDLIGFLKLESKSVQKALGHFVMEIIKEIKTCVGNGSIELNKDIASDLKLVEEEIEKILKEEKEQDLDVFIPCNKENKTSSFIYHDKFTKSNETISLLKPNNSPANQS